MNIQELKLKSSEQLITQAEDGIRDPDWSRGLGDVYKRQYYRYINEIPTLLLILIIFVVIFKPI